MMKNIIKSVNILLFLSCILATSSLAQTAPPAEEKVVLSWIQKNAIPIKYIEVGNDFSDLQPLKQILKDVKVVGLGESTHGTREIFQVKHRLLEFLVKEMGFNAYALEASHAACQPINDYVLYGKGDLETVLTGQGYVVWDTEEIREMIEWLRVYNQGVPEEKKVKFYGLDISNNENGRKGILSYLSKVAPEKVAATDSLFRVLAKEEQKWPMQVDAETENRLLHILPHLQDFINFLTVNKDTFVKKSSPAAFEQALKYAGIMKQFIMENTSALRPPFMEGNKVRSLAMAENLIYLVDREGPEAKFIVSEHNSHLARDTWKGSNLMGYQLRRKYGDEYYVFSIEFNQGAFQTRIKLPNNTLANHKEVNIPAAPSGSFPWFLSRSNVGNLILNLRAPVTNPVVKQWLNSPHKVYLGGWVYWDTDYIQEVEIMKQYDGVIFIDKTTASRPTSNALKTAAKGEGL